MNNSFLHPEIEQDIEDDPEDVEDEQGQASTEESPMELLFLTCWCHLARTPNRTRSKNDAGLAPLAQTAVALAPQHTAFAALR